MTVRAIERAGCHPGERRRHFARYRRVRVRPRRPLHARARPARTRFRRDGRDAARLDRTLSDHFHRGPVRRGRPRRLDCIHPRRPPSRADHRRRLSRRPTRSASRDARRDEACNAVLIKVNQAGTLTEAKAALDAGKAAGFGTIVSARSGESEDTRSRISPWAGTRASSRSGRSRAASAWRNGTRCCASRTGLAATRGSPAPRRYRPGNRVRLDFHAGGAAPGCAEIESDPICLRPKAGSRQLDKARARFRRGDIGGRRGDAIEERAHIGHADGIREEREHRRIVGRIADEHEAFALARRDRSRTLPPAACASSPSLS